MAGVKYVKKTSEPEPKKVITPSKPASKGTDQDRKPAANTKAKVMQRVATRDTKKADKPIANGTRSASGPAPASKSQVRTKKLEDTAMTDSKEASTGKASRKRKAPEDANPEVKKEVKKAKTTAKRPAINTAPSERLHVYVFGDGEQGELGLGAGKGGFHVSRAKLNPILSTGSVNVVQIAAGGMHAVALTAENKILTWGVNDQGALGRNTDWEGGLVDIDDNKSDGSDESLEVELNPRESTPTAVPTESFPEDTTFVQVAAGDSTTFALTDDGQVWGWGTFRSNEGIFGFSPGHLVQKEPALVAGLKNIKKVACGANHALALDASGAVYAWGSGQQNQLGRRVVERTKIQGLIPREFGLPRRAIVDIACGEYHSFAIDNQGQVWSWGLNSYCETGIADSVSEDEAVILKPRTIEGLLGRKIVCIKGGAHHSVAVTDSGECLTWGRVDGCQTGIATSELERLDVIRDQRDRIRILKVPTKVSAISEPVAMATAQSDHCMAVTKDGKVYGWGFAASKQLGLGDEDEHPVATRINSKAINEKKISAAYAGGQFGLLTSLAEAPTATMNGTNHLA
ncbi:Regulator of chromosome condensation (RCC1) repeat-containing protein 2 [Elsinoe fawcettii]|nr:Regulator of chromosome condensation (RCC1) repeat-containing protein 2 [Elsinoe fawcettii]